MSNLCDDVGASTTLVIKRVFHFLSIRCVYLLKLGQRRAKEQSSVCIFNGEQHIFAEMRAATAAAFCCAQCRTEYESMPVPTTAVHKFYNGNTVLVNQGCAELLHTEAIVILLIDNLR